MPSPNSDPTLSTSALPRFTIVSDGQPLEWNGDPNRPIRRRVLPKNQFQLLCGKCGEWVKSNAKSVQTALPHFKNHQSSKGCQSTYKALVQGLAEQQPILLAPTSTFNMSMGDCVVKQAPGCPGASIMWSQASLWHAYPFHLHDPDGQIQLPWDIDRFDHDQRHMIIRGKGCSRLDGMSGQMCRKCEAISGLAQARYDTLFGSTQHAITPNTKWEARNWDTATRHHEQQQGKLVQVRAEVSFPV